MVKTVSLGLGVTTQLLNDKKDRPNTHDFFLESWILGKRRTAGQILFKGNNILENMGVH